MKYNLFFLLIIISGNLFGQAVTKELETEIKRRVQHEINPSISIGVLYPDGTAKYYSYGYYNHKNKQPDSLTLYEIGSVTKTFTATLVNKYLKDSLSTTLSAFFPAIENSKLDSITPADLRNHIAGLPRLSNQFSPENWSDPFNGYSTDILNKELQGLTPEASGKWSYSNFGYGILGHAIEIKTGKSFDALMSGLLREAGMESTFLKLPMESNKLAQPTNVGTTNSNWNFTGPSRYAGGLISNAKDLISYLGYQKTTNPLFQSDPLGTIIQTGVPNLGEGKLFFKDGWFVLKPDSTTNILLHNGGTGGFISFIGYNKNTEFGVVVLANSVKVVDDIGIHILYPAFQLNHPKRTIAYELANAIDTGSVNGLVVKYNSLKSENYPDNIIDIYWLERFHFGQGNYAISNQLSDIMVQVLPEDWEVHDIKGQNLERLKEYKKATKAYQKAFLLNPENQLLKEKIKRCTILNK
jgi:CubicO group peptidase (beta-lactamase class C family)